MTGFIPVRNIFYMLLYAWNKWPQSEPLSVGGVQNPYPSARGRLV